MMGGEEVGGAAWRAEEWIGGRVLGWKSGLRGAGGEREASRGCGPSRAPHKTVQIDDALSK